MSLSKHLSGLMLLRFLLAGLVCATGGATSAAAQNTTIFGPNVYVLDPSMSPSTVNAQLNALNSEGQFSTHRYEVLFKPGTYGTSSTPVLAQVGFYESIAGLGTTPGQVTITGGLASDQLIDGNMTQNFWRSQENLTEVPVGGLTSGILDWGVSQGASLRRLSIQGGLFLTNSGSIGQTDPCSESSGGFIADTSVSGLTNACSQQQWYTRNSVLSGGFDGNVWNFVFSGVLPANVPAQSYPSGPGGDVNVTNLATTPVSREKPFLYLDGSGNYNVFVPALKTVSSGTSWSGGTPGTGYSMPINSFFVATPASTLAQINAALAAGQSLILTPGIYRYSNAITITKANTIVLGMGYATLVPQAGTPAISVADVDGVQLAGLLIDAGPVNSPVLVEVGNPNGPNNSHAANPASLNDVFFRIGGGTLGTATTSLQVDSGDVILDNIWAWRADHGNNGTVGWTANTAAHGLVVNGDNVTALGLAVEHYQQSQVQWNGNGGQTIFYQSELPYDPPSQSAWSNGTANGYPSYAVAPSVCTHTASGLGFYSFFNLGVNIVEDSAMTVPTTSGITVKDAGTVWLNGSGQISNVINATGGSASAANPDTLVPVSSYLGSEACAAQPPVPPTNLIATAVSSSQINLTWTASTTPGVSYEIFGSANTPPTISEANLLASVAGTSYSATGLTPSTLYYYAVVAVGSTTSTPARASATTEAASAVVSVNAGGGSVGSFVPDTDFSGGATYANSTPVSVAGVANAAPVAVYQDQREGVFTYTVPGLGANTKHTVTLHFAELYFRAAGSRKFNVSINGTPVLTNFDIVQTAGSAYKAVVEQFTATANAIGQIAIQFTRGSVDQPALSGLVIQ
jgi:hypothetical protein